MNQNTAVIGKLWDALNRQDLEAARALLHPEVDWQDIINNGRRNGPGSVMDYWRQLFSVMRTETTVVENRSLGNGRIACSVHHLVRDPQGGIRTDEPLTHIFSFRDGLIIRMDAE